MENALGTGRARGRRPSFLQLTRELPTIFSVWLFNHRNNRCDSAAPIPSLRGGRVPGKKALTAARVHGEHRAAVQRVERCIQVACQCQTGRTPDGT